ncbi:STAS-like domain-containing protein [Bradyrhizobium sp.]|uniref:STAS-like domain-containing protein n=1 Tax=Bradyrhizobium sp. TaxID=376 RepID=UPI003C33FABD
MIQAISHHTQLMIRTETNKIIFEGDLKSEIMPAISRIYHLSQKLGYQDIVLDFSGATYADATLMLPLSSFAAFHRKHHIDFSLVEPADGYLRRLFKNANWAHFIDPTSYDLNEKRRFNNLPALQFTDGDAQHAVVNKAMEVLMETIKVQERKQLKALEWALNEITDNVLNHAESPTGGMVQIQSFPTNNTVTFYVADTGLGIAATLRRAIPSITSDTDALDRAIREGVTRNQATNQGNGLFGTFKCCEVSNGRVEIISNHAHLSWPEKTGLSIRQENVPFGGSFIAATINYSTAGLLEKAFVFRGRVHEPANDYIEAHYETQGEKLIFRVAQEIEGFGSREFGRRARQKIDNILVEKDIVIEFDFSDIPLISSSFADEVFGKLFVQLGALEFMRRCTFRAVDPTVKTLIDRAIALRMKSNLNAGACFAADVRDGSFSTQSGRLAMSVIRPNLPW